MLQFNATNKNKLQGSRENLTIKNIIVEEKDEEKYEEKEDKGKQEEEEEGENQTIEEDKLERRREGGRQGRGGRQR